jgi:nicotinamide mononucleotide transporter
MGHLEIIALISTLICVWLTAKQNILCWPVGIVGVIAFFVLFFTEKLYFQAILQVIFLFQSIYGWFLWEKSLSEGKFEVKTLQINTIIRHITLILVISAPLGYFMGVYTSSTLPLLDGITTGMALLATYYLSKQYVEGWLVWMGVNILLGGMMLYQGLYIIAILEVILLIISLIAYKSWKKNLRTDFA